MFLAIKVRPPIIDTTAAMVGRLDCSTACGAETATAPNVAPDPIDKAPTPFTTFDASALPWSLIIISISVA